jgi:hypothetical protein
MKIFEDWLAEFSKKLQDAYRVNRADTKFVGLIRDIDKPVGLLPFGNGIPISFADIDMGHEVESYVLTGQEVKAYNIGMSYQIDEWAKAPELNDPDGVLMDIALEIMGRNIAQREAYLIIKTLMDRANTILPSIEKGVVRSSDIYFAEKRIADHGFMPDTIIMEPWQRYQLLIEENVDLGRFEDLMHNGRYNYGGKVSNMDVYTTEVIKDTCLIYDKDYVSLIRTPFKIYFDNIESPKFLVVDRICFVAPVDPRSVIAVNIRKLNGKA